MKQYYFPIVKGKRTSFTALANLKDTTKPGLLPIIELILPPQNPKKPDEKPTFDRTIKGLIKSLGTMSFGLDFHYLDMLGQNTRPNITGLIDDIVAMNVSFYPITHLESSPEYQTTIRKYWKTTELPLIVRVFPKQKSLSETLSGLEAIKRFFGIDNGKIILLIDYESVADGNGRLLVPAIEQFLLPLIKEKCLQLILAAGGAPVSQEVAHVINKSKLFPRNDFYLFTELAKNPMLTSGNLAFGDYTTRSPELPFSGPNPNEYPSLRYTVENEFYVWRGINRKKHEEGRGQIREGCRALIKERFYRGPLFSDGDQKITDLAANRSLSPGSPEVWAQIGINQHIEYITHQISRMS